MRERRAFVYRRQFPTRGDKAVRAQSIRGRMAMDGLYLPADAPWVPEFRHELLTFDAGRHDDQVDASGSIGQLLDRMRPGRAAAEVAPPRPTELIFQVGADGRLIANMTVREVVEMKMRRKQREG